MKLPYAFIFGPPLRRYADVYNKICSPTILGFHWLVVGFAILGLIVSVVDIMRIISGGPLLSKDLWRNRLHRSERIGRCYRKQTKCICTRSKEFEAWERTRVSPEIERDMKLMASILAVEHFIMMGIGALTSNPALLQPWLMVEGVILLLEAFLLATRMVMEGIHLSRAELFICAIMLHNWLQAFCLFKRFLKLGCDL